MKARLGVKEEEVHEWIARYEHCKTEDPCDLKTDDLRLKPLSSLQKFGYICGGLVDNRQHKTMFLLYRAELAVLHQTLTDLTEYMQDKELQGERETDDEYDEISRKIRDAFNSLNGLIVFSFVALSMSKTPMTRFLKAYTHRRDSAFEEARLEEVETGRMSLHVRHHLCTVAIRAVAQCNTMGDLIHMQLSQTDELPFKIFLFVVNVITCVGQFTYDTYINPQET